MKELINSIKEYCIYNYENIAVAENITSGYVQMLLGSVEQAGQYFQGGITTYTQQQLSDLLYAEKLVPLAKAPGAIPIEYAQRIIRILAEKLFPEQEEITYTTAEILEPLS